MWPSTALLVVISLKITSATEDVSFKDFFHKFVSTFAVPQHWRSQPDDFTYPEPVLPSFKSPVDCLERPKHFEFEGHWYFHSAHVDEYNQYDVQGRPILSYEDAFNLCRGYCMDPVNIETEKEWKMVQNFINNHSIIYTWTSGHRCDFQGCENIVDKPLIVNGWFWLGKLAKLPPTDRVPINPDGTEWSEQPWLQRGVDPRVPQPDNAEFFRSTRQPESCLGLLWDGYETEGVYWHDIACHHGKHVLCEDNDAELERAHRLIKLDQQRRAQSQQTPEQQK